MCSIQLYALYSYAASRANLQQLAKLIIYQTTRKGIFIMSRPAIPMELKKKHRREYMRRYRKQKSQQSFGTAFQRTRSPLTAEGNTDNNTADKMKGETQE